MQDYVANGVLDVWFVSTKDQLEDPYYAFELIKVFYAEEQALGSFEPASLMGGVRDINDNMRLM